MAGRVIQAFAQFFDSAGDPLENGWLRFLESGSNNTDKNTFADSGLQVNNENPLQLDAGGRCSDVFGTGDYRIVLFRNDPEDEDSPGEQVAVFDPVTAQGATTSGGGGGGFGEWDAVTEYDLGDIVTYNAKYYRSLIVANQNLNPALETYAWEEIDFVHIWNSTVNYEAGNVVYRGSNLYLSLQNSNLNQDPETAPAWWRPIASGVKVAQTKTAAYEILPAERDNLFILGAATAADTQFDLPLMDATTDRFQLFVYNASNFVLTLDPLGTSSIWLQSSLAVDKGALVSLIYDFSLDTWLVGGGNTGPALGGQTLGTAANPVANIEATAATIATLTGTAATITTIGATTANLTTINTDEIHLGDNNYIYLGDSDDASIRFEPTGNELEIAVPGTSDIHVIFGGIVFWIMEDGGAFRPGASNPSGDLGTTTNRVDNIFTTNIDLPDSGEVRIGNSDDLTLYHSAGINYIDSDVALYIRTVNTNHIHFYAGGTYAMEIEDDGQVYFKDHINLLDSQQIKLGNSADMEIFHTGVNGYIDCNTGDFIIRDGTTTVIEFNSTRIDSSEAIRISGTGSFEVASGTVKFGYFGGLYGWGGTGAGNIYVYTNNAARWYYDTDGNYLPNTSGAVNIGSTTRRVDTIYAVNALNTSDRRFKTDIEELHLGLKFINDLRPVSFKLTEVQTDRTRFGLIAQEVFEVVQKNGLGYNDFGALHHDAGQTNRWDIDYSHFISILIKAIQDLDRKIERKLKDKKPKKQ